MTAKKDDLLNAVKANLEAAGVESTKAFADTVITAVLNGVLATAKEGGSIRTEIGIFKFQERDARVGRNPKTGEPVQVAAYKFLSFKVASTTRESAAPVKATKGKTVAAKPTAKVAPKATAKVVAPKVAPKATVKAAPVAVKPAPKVAPKPTAKAK